MEKEAGLMNSKKKENETINIKKVYIVLGMHRSATSLTTEILSKIGLYIGNKEDMLEADPENKDGYFEIKKIVQLNDEILLENNMVWCCVKANPLGLKTKKNLSARFIINELSNKAHDRNIAIKDPRFCLTEPIWRNEIINLGMKPKAIIVVRHPFEVAQSLVRRDNIDFDYALKIWFYYNCCILNIITRYQTEDLLFLNHQDFFSSNIQLEKIMHFCNKDYKSLPNNIIKKELRHNYSDNISSRNNELHKFIFELYNFLLDISRKNIILTKEIVKKFNGYLKEISCTSYKPDNSDMFFNAMYHCHYAWFKTWCLNLLQKEKWDFSGYFNAFFKRRNISKIILYGYGTVAKVILEMLDSSCVKCIGFIDKNIPENNPGELLVYNKIPVNIPGDIFILNTVVNYEDEISCMFCTVQTKEKYISLKQIIYEFYKENIINKYKDYNI